MEGFFHDDLETTVAGVGVDDAGCYPGTLQHLDKIVGVEEENASDVQGRIDRVRCL